MGSLRKAAASSAGDSQRHSSGWRWRDIKSYFFAGILHNLQYRQSRAGNMTFLYDHINMHTLGTFIFYGLGTKITKLLFCIDGRDETNYLRQK